MQQEDKFFRNIVSKLLWKSELHSWQCIAPLLVQMAGGNLPVYALGSPGGKDKHRSKAGAPMSAQSTDRATHCPAALPPGFWQIPLNKEVARKYL